MRCAQCRKVLSLTNYNLTERRNSRSFVDWLPVALRQSRVQYMQCSQIGMKLAQDIYMLDGS